MWLLMAISAGMLLLHANAQENTVLAASDTAAGEVSCGKVVSEISDSSIKISLAEKISLKELEKQFPSLR